MGSAEKYCVLSLSKYTSNKRLRDRIKCIKRSGGSPEISLEDWYIWYYTLLECVFKKLAIYYGVELSSNLHNIQGIFSHIANENVKGGKYSKEFVELLSSRLGTDGSDFRYLNKYLGISISRARYYEDYLPHLRELNVDFAISFLVCSFEFLVEKTGINA